jgi:tryptophan halogenase
MNLHLAQQMILLALELLPGRGFSTAEADEYNRRAEQLTARLRDFLALHYLCSGRSGAIWTALEERQPPDSLARTLDQYRYRARLSFFEEEPLTRDSWTAALLGLGILPSHADPQSCSVPLDKVVPAMRQLAQEIEQAVARVPTYAAYLAGMRA